MAAAQVHGVCGNNLVGLVIVSFDRYAQLTVRVAKSMQPKVEVFHVHLEVLQGNNVPAGSFPGDSGLAFLTESFEATAHASATRQQQSCADPLIEPRKHFLEAGYGNVVFADM